MLCRDRPVCGQGATGHQSSAPQAGTGPAGLLGPRPPTSLVAPQPSPWGCVFLSRSRCVDTVQLSQEHIHFTRFPCPFEITDGPSSLFCTRTFVRFRHADGDCLCSTSRPFSSPLTPPPAPLLHTVSTLFCILLTCSTATSNFHPDP